MAPAKTASAFSLVADPSSLDPTLSSLFSSSSGPSVPTWTRESRKGSAPQRTLPASSEPQVLTEASNSEEDEDVDESRESATQEQVDEIPARKRKRKNDNEQLEEVYLQRLAKEEAAEEAQRKRQRTGNEALKQHIPDEDAEDEILADDNDFELIPQHETLAPSDADASIDKASRTIFLANVSSTAITSKSSKKTLLTHLSSFLSTLPASPEGPHTVESLRFRSTAFASAIPKKAAFARKDLKEATTKSTNAYAVYSTTAAAKAAPRHLNGTVVLGRHLRVDSVSHPSKVDHRRCVFVGNLGFVDDASQIEAADAEEQERKPRKKSAPGDVEEGLWQQFGKAGKVESVRVVRDPKTRVGKGFAYVQFVDQNGVEAALLFNDKKFPPMLPRKLRVVRAKNPDYITKSKDTAPPAGNRGPRVSRKFDRNAQNPNHDKLGQASLHGQMKKLLGKAGADDVRPSSKEKTTFKSPESFVVEGHRASSTGDTSKALGMRNSGKKKGSGKPRGRSARRAATWKQKGKSNGVKK